MRHGWRPPDSASRHSASRRNWRSKKLSDQSRTERDQQWQAEREEARTETTALRDLVHSLQEQLALLKARREQGPAEGGQQCLVAPSLSRAADQNLNQGPGQSSPRPETQDSSSEAKREVTHRNLKPTAGVKKHRKRRNDQTAAKEILVCGDGNAARIAKALRHQLKGELSVKTRFRRGATIATAQRLLQRYCDEAGKSERLVILHAGVSDVTKSAQPDEVAKIVRDQIIPYAQELVICSVPEVTSRGKETHARAMMLNTELKKIGMSETTFLDLSEAVRGEGRLARDGIHYLAKTSRDVATEVVEHIRPFLGDVKRGRRSNRRQGKQDETGGQGRPMPTTTTNTTTVETGLNQSGDWGTPTQGPPAGIPLPERFLRRRHAQESVSQLPPAPMHAGIQAIPGYPPVAGAQYWGYRHGLPVGPVQCATPSPASMVQPLNHYPGTDLFHVVGDWVRHHMSLQRPLQQ
ncbi:hypothetical protein HPB48_002070 [Haemaphysalis longicornis]|uniref:Uncharacterized protein n=1 Tax=Haemaphysalis longicornis TaxID=44386 RepID=A0A9J6FJK0_HAELO|nr:hypothetical protein HPB48_002070 [Haemaphysalis longicornis]